MKCPGSDTITLVSASQLAFRGKWRRIATCLPAGSALFVVPTDETPMKRSMRKVAETLHQQGWRIVSVHSATS